MRVLVVDDHPLFRRGLLEVLGDEPDITVCAEAASAAAARDAVAHATPDVVIVDLSLGSESGLDLIVALVRTHPGVRILVVSSHDERVHADRALRAGALGYVMKDKAADQLVAAIRRVAAGKTFVSAETAERILGGLGRTAHRLDESPLNRLTDRERHVLTLMGRGHATREIAAELGLSVKTVESHYAHIKEKLGARHGRELMRVAVQWAEDGTL